MKRKHYFYMLGLSATMLLGACSYEDRDFENLPSPSVASGEGYLNLNLSAGSEFEAQTRSVNENEYAITDNYDVTVTDALDESKVVLSCKGEELVLNRNLRVKNGAYHAVAKFGIDEENYVSRTQFGMFGETYIRIEGDTPSATINCKPTCGKVAVEFDGMSQYFEEFKVDFAGSKTFAWAQTDTDPWYVSVPAKGETINYTITLKAKEAYRATEDKKSVDGTATGSFQLTRSQFVTLTVKPNYIETADGGIQLKITIDEKTTDRDVTIVVPVDWI